jgi:hypothetical protein
MNDSARWKEAIGGVDNHIQDIFTVEEVQNEKHSWWAWKEYDFCFSVYARMLYAG